MSADTAKLDRGLSALYRKFLNPQTATKSLTDAALTVGTLKLHVVLRYHGNLTAAKAAGFELVWDNGEGMATGSLSLKDLPVITRLDEVLKISYGEEDEPFLDHSIPDIKADQVWARSGSTFTGDTGAGVIIGVLDTLRIRDQGLVPAGAEQSPPLSLLHPGTPGQYGTEYIGRQ